MKLNTQPQNQTPPSPTTSPLIISVNPNHLAHLWRPLSWVVCGGICEPRNTGIWIQVYSKSWLNKGCLKGQVWDSRKENANHQQNKDKDNSPYLSFLLTQNPSLHWHYIGYWDNTQQFSSEANVFIYGSKHKKKRQQLHSSLSCMKKETALIITFIGVTLYVDTPVIGVELRFSAV